MEDRRKNLFLGSFLGSIGLVFAAGAVFASTHLMEIGSETDTDLLTQACMTQARDFGFDARLVGDNLILENQADDLSSYVSVGRVSALFGFCPTFQLGTLCVGSECGDAVNFIAILSRNP